MNPSFQELEKFALDVLGLEKFPQDHYQFRMFGCPNCAAVPLMLKVEYHTSQPREGFRGKIFGACTQCSRTSEVFSFTGEGRAKEKTEGRQCPCGNKTFFAGRGERFSDEEEIRGFAEEGVAVSQCKKCGKKEKIIEF